MTDVREPGVRREAIVRSIFDAFNRRDRDAGLALLAPGIVLEAVSGTVLREGRPYVGHDGLRRYFADIEEHWDELVVEPSQIRAAGSAVVALGHVSGAGSGGPLEAAPATWVFKFDGDLVAQIQIFSDPELARRALEGTPRGNEQGETLVAIVSDTHLPRGNRTIPEQGLALMRDADAILHAGDFSTVAVLEQLSALGPPLSAVCGNVEEPALRARLPVAAELELGGVRLGVIHNAGPSNGRLERLRQRFPTCVAAIFGHSHIPLLERCDGFQIFNPGSPTDRRGQPQHTMGLARIADGAVAFEHIELGA